MLPSVGSMCLHTVTASGRHPAMTHGGQSHANQDLWLQPGAAQFDAILRFSNTYMSHKFVFEKVNTHREISVPSS